MFAVLRAAVDALEVPADAAAIAEAAALRDRLEAKVAGAVGRFAMAGGPEADGALSTAAWLRHRTGADPSDAHRQAVAARKLAALPVTRRAFADGMLSRGQVAVVLAHVRTGHLARFAGHEPELVPLLAPLPVDQVARATAEWRARADALDALSGPPVPRPHTVHLARTLDGRGELHGSLDADLHALLEAGFRVADGGDHELPLPERRAEALATVFQHFLDHQHCVVGGRHRPHVNVVLSPDRLHEARYLDTDQPVTPAALGVLLCDAAFHRLVTDGAGAVLDDGRATRIWPGDLYNAIAVRDQGRRFPGCDRPASWCDVHHAREWDAHGGTTSIRNGVLLCRRHHRLLHGGHGFAATLRPDATLEVTRPDGRTETTRPRGTIRCARPPGERPALARC